MKHFLSIADLTPEALADLLDLGFRLKEEWRNGGNEPVLRGKNLALVFMKPSLRTRVSFEMAMVHLGGYAFYLGPDEIKLGSRESVPDVARVLSSYVDCIMARVFAHDHIMQLAEYSSVPVINGLSDYNHPAQALADLFTIREAKGALEGLTVAFVGDGNNVARSLLFGAMKTGMNFVMVAPEGYTLSEQDLASARGMRLSQRQTVSQTTDPIAGVQDADVIYTDVWTSMGQEAETERRLQAFPPFQLNERLVSQASSGVIIMHCLPAHRGEEITDAVADGPHSVLFQQAENRMHAQKAILYDLLVRDS
ncbi:MAG TPA: ornithine carbamoyltransferase [Candidatus Binatia bacterium]|jgi:ornithine carbamoyltransferase|nr:ornithine carbamoyltransferase [Candidatus Binatia bacterium]